MSRRNPMCSFAVPGAAIATVAAQGLSFLLAILYLRRNEFPFAFHLSEFRIQSEKARKLLKIGVPVSLQDTLTMLSFLFITAIVNRIGVSASAAVGLSSKISNFTLLPPSAISAAVAAMTAQNIGAGKPKRAIKCLYTGIVISLIFGTVCFLWMHFLPQTAARLFDGNMMGIGAAVPLASFCSILIGIVYFLKLKRKLENPALYQELYRTFNK